MHRQRLEAELATLKGETPATARNGSPTTGPATEGQNGTQKRARDETSAAVEKEEPESAEERLKRQRTD